MCDALGGTFVDGRVHCTPELAMAGVSPMKVLTIPQLELLAARLASETELKMFLLTMKSNIVLPLPRKFMDVDKQRNFSVGDGVLIQYKCWSRSKWKFGKIVGVSTGSDALALEVKLVLGNPSLKQKRPQKIIEGPVNKVVLLLECESI